MPTTIEHQTTGVKYVWNFNQDVETGTFWDGSPYVIAKPDLKLVSMKMETADGIFDANTIVEDIELGWKGKAGFKGELYINGLVKNPNAMMDIDQNGRPRYSGNQHDCRSFGTFNNGWRREKSVRDPVTKKLMKVPTATNDPSSYSNDFNLTKFMEMHNTLRSGQGVPIEVGDSLLVAYSNFDRNCPHTWNISYNSGYPYQKIVSRSCVMSYGTVFVLEKHPTEVCFRPPMFWPEEDRKNRPMHPVSKAVSNLPASDELTTHTSTQGFDRVPNFNAAPAFRTFCYGFPLGSGITYSQRLPLYTASANANITAANAPSAYGAYYQAPLLGRLASLYSKDAPEANRIEALKVIVQWGIDAFGSIKSFGQTTSGAGQRPCVARPWSIVAGHFLGQPAMRMPESIMLQDTKRADGYFNNVMADMSSEGEAQESDGADDDIRTITDGVPENRGKQFTVSQWRNWMYGDFNTLQGKKRRLARFTSLESVCYHKVVDDPTNLIFHYDYMGASHRRSFTGEGCIFGMTTPTERVPVPRLENATGGVTGNFAKMQWMTTLPTELTGWGFSHDGKPTTFPHAYIQITEGPGSGNTLYRILHQWGNMRTGNNGGQSNNPNFLGFGLVLDRPWANGTPDQTSKIRMITCTKENVGETLYIISPDLHQPMSADANLSPSTPYGDICEDLLVRIYGWMHYIKNRTGSNPDLDADSTFAHDYIQRIIFTNPYNWATYSTHYTVTGARQWEVSVMNRWYNRPATNAETAKTIDWRGIPGILTWFGVPVANNEVQIKGDLNNDGVIDGQDMALLLSRWGSNYTDYDLNNDGVVDAADLTILQSNWGKKKKT